MINKLIEKIIISELNQYTSVDSLCTALEWSLWHGLEPNGEFYYFPGQLGLCKKFFGFEISIIGMRIIFIRIRSFWYKYVFYFFFRYSTLFTMPYLIVAHYHETNTVIKYGQTLSDNHLTTTAFRYHKIIKIIKNAICSFSVIVKKNSNTFTM